MQDTSKGTPQAGILSPLLANMALTALDEHFAEQRSDRIERARRRRHGLANVRLIRYADDFARHEAPHYRVEVEGLHRLAVAAAG